MQNDKDHHKPCKEDIRAYLAILQTTINRMATNSLYCKIICATLIAAFGTIGKLKGGSFIVAGIFPLSVCAWADVMYLSLERVYRNKFNEVVKENYKSDGEDKTINIFDMNPGTEYTNLDNMLRSFKSWSIWPIYLILLFYICILSCIKN